MTNSLIGASSIHLKDRVYVVGGYNGTTYSQVVAIKPQDTICLTATSESDCRAILGCDFCVNGGIGVCIERTTPDRFVQTKIFKAPRREMAGGI
jgi:hypothetical protein